MLARGDLRTAAGDRVPPRCCSRGALLLFTRLGQEFTPTLDEKNIVMEVERVPSTSLSQSQAMQLDSSERSAISAGRLRVLAHRHARSRRRSDAAELSDTYIILKPQSEWPDPGHVQGRR